jgi:AmiR/NasT family two-component response regulator
VSEWHLDTVAPVAQVLAARLADIADRHRLTVAFAAEQAAHRRSTQVAQATGILSERRRTDLADAMRHLESQAQRSGSSLVDAAAAILAETSAAPVRIPMQRVDLPPTIEPPRHRRRPA